MNPGLLERISQLLKEVEELPDRYYFLEEHEAYRSGSDETRKAIREKIQARDEQRKDVYASILAFLRAHHKKDNFHMDLLGQVDFKSNGYDPDSFDPSNNEAWSYGRYRLLKVVELLKKEWSGVTQGQETSLKTRDKSIFHNPLFWTILTIVGTACFFFGKLWSDLKTSDVKAELRDTKKELVLVRKENQELKRSPSATMTDEVEEGHLEFWTGIWFHTERWSTRTSEGIMKIDRAGASEGEVSGYAYNVNQEKSEIKGRISEDGKSLSGTWRNFETNQEGTFRFDFESNETFGGYYTLGGIQNDWSGSKVAEEFQFKLNINTPSKTLGFRTRLLTSAEFRGINNESNLLEETLIGALIDGQTVQIIDSKNDQYRVAAKIKGEIRLGYISKTMSGINVIDSRN